MQAVKMYTTAVCPYCIRAKQMLKSKGVEQIEEVRIDTDPAARTHMMARRIDAAAGRCIILPHVPAAGTVPAAGFFVWAAHGVRPG